MGMLLRRHHDSVKDTAKVAVNVTKQSPDNADNDGTQKRGRRKSAKENED